MELPFEQRQLVREWIVDGRTDEEIAEALAGAGRWVSVKQIRPIRSELEAELRPR